MAFEKLKGKKFTAVTSSVGVRGKEIYRKIPAVLRLGKKNRSQGGFFDYEKLLKFVDKTKNSPFYGDDTVIVMEDSSSKEISVLITASLFQPMMYEFMESQMPSSSYATVSQSFQQITDGTAAMPFSEQYIGILTLPFEQGSIGSGSEVIPPPTCSIEISEAPGIAYNTDNTPRVRKTTYFNSSSNFTNSHFEFTWHNSSHGNLGYDTLQEAQTDALVAKGLSHLTRSFGQQPGGNSADRFYYVQSSPISEFSFLMSSSAGSSSFFTLTSSFSGAADFGLLSGSLAGKIDETSTIRPKYYNDVDATDGAYLYVVQKGYVEGEGEFGQDEVNFVDNFSSLAFTPQQLLVWYSPDYYCSNVRSASFYFTPYPTNMHELNTGATTKALITGSISSSENIGTGELRTLYWLNHSYTGSFTASFGYAGTRAQLKDRTGEANNTQLPYMRSDKGRRFSIAQASPHSSHLWKNEFLSQPADEGYYVHSASFSAESKGQMTASLGSANHSSSFFVMGVFKHPFVPGLGGAVINYSSSQFRDPSVTGQTWMSHHPLASCMFLKRHDNAVFQHQATSSGSPTEIEIS
tara:strand:- start:6846 stop:8576 length:1731 start_codon:yes stop_codon:yes gene_type:complete